MVVLEVMSAQGATAAINGTVNTERYGIQGSGSYGATDGGAQGRPDVPAREAQGDDCEDGARRAESVEREGGGDDPRPSTQTAQGGEDWNRCGSGA